MSLKVIATKSTSTTEPEFDIVAVHGLGGDPYGSWTHDESKKCWIKDFLPEDCRQARIMTFEYPSAIVIETFAQDIQDVAKKLLNSLKVRRHDCALRPLVFITHSLGGIIVKDALGIAKNDPEYQDLAYSSTKGIVFFGTPHRGSTAADLGARISRVASFMMRRPHNELVNALRPGSEILSRISETFRHSAPTWKFISIFEEEPVKGFKDLIVDQFAARLDYPNESQISVSRNHLDMCKFKDRDDLYLSIIIRIHEMVQLPRVVGASQRFRMRPLGRRLQDFYIHRSVLHSKIEGICVTSPMEDGVPKSCLVHGIGGSGKSQACLKFFNDEQNSFDHQFWIDGSSEKNVQEGFEKMAKRIGLRTIISAHEDVITWLEEQTERWLLVFDDVSASELDLPKYLPDAGNGFILLSAQRDFDCIHTNLEIDDLSTDDTSRLLLKLCRNEPYNRTDDDAARELVDSLHRHPLAICIAGSFIRNRRTQTIGDYHQKWRDHVFKNIEDKNNDPTGYRRSVGATFQMTLDEISALNDSYALTARNILCLLAFLYHEHISHQIFHDAWEHRYQVTSDPDLDGAHQPWIEVSAPGESDFRDSKDWAHIKSNVERALAFLETYSLVSSDEASDSDEDAKWPVISVHSLVHAWIYKSMTESERNDWYTKAATILAANYREQQPMSHDLVFHIDHILSSKFDVRNICEIPCQLADEQCFTAASFADIYSSRGYYTQANRLRSRICSEVGQSDDRSHHVACLGLLADSFTDLGQHQEALGYRKTAFEIAKHRSFHEESDGQYWQFLRCMRELAQSARQLGNHREACERRNTVYNLTAELHRRYPTRRDIELMFLIDNRERAVSLLDLGEWAAIVPILHQVFVAHQKIAHEADPELLQSQGELANVYSLVGKHQEALKHRRAVLTQRKRIDPDKRHPDTLIATEHVALSLIGEGEFDGAYSLRYEVLEEWDKLSHRIPADFPPLMRAKLNFAHNCEVIGMRDKALKVCNEVIECKRQFAAQYHLRRCPHGNKGRCEGRLNAFLCPTTHEVYRTDEAIEALERKALVQHRRNDPQEVALENLELVLRIWKIKLRVAPQHHHRYLASRNTLVSLRANNDDKIKEREAILSEQLKEVPDKNAKTLTTKKLDTLTTMLALGRNYFKGNNYLKASEHFSFVLKHGKQLETVLPHEFKEAKEMYEKIEKTLQQGRPATVAQKSPPPTSGTPQQRQRSRQESFPNHSRQNVGLDPRGPAFRRSPLEQLFSMHDPFLQSFSDFDIGSPGRGERRQSPFGNFW